MKLFCILVAFCFAALVASNAHAQDFNLPCAAQAALAASQHQCVSPNRFMCAIEKFAVGYGAYRTCTQQTRFNRRANRRIRRARIRQAWLRG